MIPTIHNIKTAKKWSEIFDDKCKEYTTLYNCVKRELGGISNFETIRHITNDLIEATNKEFGDTNEFE